MKETEDYRRLIRRLTLIFRTRFTDSNCILWKPSVATQLIPVPLQAESQKQTRRGISTKTSLPAQIVRLCYSYLAAITLIVLCNATEAPSPSLTQRLIDQDHFPESFSPLRSFTSCVTMDPFSSNISPVSDVFLDDEKTSPNVAKIQNVRVSNPQSEPSSVSLPLTGYTAKPFITILKVGTGRVWSRSKEVAVVGVLIGIAVCMVEATTLCQLALATCHFSQFLCDLPTALQPPIIVRMCEWTPQFYDGNSWINAKCRPKSSTVVLTEAHDALASPYMHSVLNPSWPSQAENRAALQQGAAVIPYFTSPTYNLTEPPLYIHALQKYTGFFVHRPSVVRATSVLDEEYEPGDCWQFTSGGKIGIRFADRVNISAITFNKISAHLVSEEARLQAPSVVIAWGLIRSLDALVDSAVGDTSIIRKPSSLASSGRSLPSDIPTSAFFLRMARFRYSGQFPNPWQYQAIDVGIPVEVLVLEFEASADASLTCVHTIGVHGDLVDW